MASERERERECEKERNTYNKLPNSKSIDKMLLDLLTAKKKSK